jgi:hypothetical protein
MTEVEKMWRGWHGNVSRNLGRKPLYRVSLMRKDQHWFNGTGQTFQAAFNRAVKAAGGSPTATGTPRLVNDLEHK